MEIKEIEKIFETTETELSKHLDNAQKEFSLKFWENNKDLEKDLDLWFNKLSREEKYAIFQTSIPIYLDDDLEDLKDTSN